MNHPPVFALPPEIYFLIVRYLSKKDLAASVLVCKTWFLYFRPYLWQELDLRKRDHLLRFGKIPETALLRNAHVIQTLRTRFSEVVGALIVYGPTCTNLRNFRITADNADLDAVLYLIRQNVFLQDISLQGRLISTEGDLLRIFEALPITLSKLTLGSNGLETFSEAGDSEDSEDEEEEEEEDQYEHFQDGAVGINLENHVWALTSLTIRLYFPFCKTLHQFIMRAPLLETLCLKNVTALDVDRLAECLIQCCPSLATLRLRACEDCNSFPCPEEDAAWATVIAGGCQFGWKRIDLKGNYLGDAAYKALMDLVPSLESIVHDFRTGLDSPDLQTILCSASFLKELIVNRTFPDMCTAELDCDSIDDDPWVCHSLETLKVVISCVPRPDLCSKTNGHPLTGRLHRGTMAKSYKVQQRVYRQLGAMTKLKNLTLGTRINEENWEREQYEDEQVDEGEYYDHENLQQGLQYACLSFTLESGLGLLSGLRELETIDLRNMSVGLMQEAELQWVRWNWPHLKAIHLREFDGLAEDTRRPTPSEFHRDEDEELEDL
ncbi:hypothetical protein BGZ70_001493 [Mortierella alpina]|uniref:F-box domain-containing protein n=1 Tax=Mortierella alpina TaxID=64518 RepID=A0A9P6IZ29_MORAP|nr:hypothetical protein BGZ70_001493 [Mortierella alpina]